MTKSAPLEHAKPRTCKPGFQLATLLAAGLLFFPAIALHAQQLDRIQPSRINAARLRWFQYKLVAGRILATSAYPEGMNISFGPSTTDPKRREHLQLLILEDRASIRYELASDGEELSIQLAETGEFSIRRTRREPPLTLSFIQPPDKPMSLVMQQDGQSQEFVGSSFWHLYLAAPELVGQELVPYLETLRPAWQLVATGEHLQRNLIQRAKQPPAHRSEQWRSLVDGLGSTHFAEREAAQRDLAASGQVVLPFLEDLDPAQLDAEQVARVEKLITNLRVNYEDTADRVANWLIGDVSIWLSIAERPELAKREVARQQLQSLTGEAIDFDPAAEEEMRIPQVAALRHRLLPTQAVTGPLPATGPPPDSSVPPPALER